MGARRGSTPTHHPRPTGTRPRFGSPHTLPVLIRLIVSLSTETARVVGIVAILFLIGTVRVFKGHGRAVHGNALEILGRSLFAIAAFAGILTAGRQFIGEVIDARFVLVIVWVAFVLLLPSLVIQWVRAREIDAIRDEVRRASSSVSRVSLSTGLFAWVFLVLTDRAGQLPNLRLYILGLIVLMGAVQLLRIPRVPVPAPAPPDESASDSSAVQIPETTDEVTSGV